MFNALNPEELEIVLDAMSSVRKKANEVVIREGEDGDNLYVVEKGTLTCTKIFVSQSCFINFRLAKLNQLSSKNIILVKLLVNLRCFIMLHVLQLLLPKQTLNYGHLIDVLLIS